MSIYVPPVSPGETYSQGFWHAVLAAATYFIGGSMLVANMVGYLLGHYPQQFDLDDDQRTLILQTMMFFFWLAAGAGIYCRLEDWTYVNALYWCDVVSSTLPILHHHAVSFTGAKYAASPSLPSATATS